MDIEDEDFFCISEIEAVKKDLAHFKKVFKLFYILRDAYVLYNFFPLEICLSIIIVFFFF